MTHHARQDTGHIWELASMASRSPDEHKWWADIVEGEFEPRMTKSGLKDQPNPRKKLKFKEFKEKVSRPLNWAPATITKRSGPAKSKLPKTPQKADKNFKKKFEAIEECHNIEDKEELVEWAQAKEEEFIGKHEDEYVGIRKKLSKYKTNPLEDLCKMKPHSLNSLSKDKLTDKMEHIQSYLHLSKEMQDLEKEWSRVVRRGQTCANQHAIANPFIKDGVIMDIEDVFRHTVQRDYSRTRYKYCTAITQKGKNCQNAVDRGCIRYCYLHKKYGGFSRGGRGAGGRRGRGRG